METKFKDVAHYYLGTGLQCSVLDKGQEKTATLNGIYDNGECVFYDLVESQKGFDKIIPHLRPMSDLKKPLADGSVPIAEMVRIIFPDLKRNGIRYCFGDYSKLIFGTESTQGAYQFIINHHPLSFEMVHCGKPIHIPSVFELFQYLLSKNFNLFNLPETDYIKLTD